MITIQQHIDQQHGGNVSAFARSVSASRPTVYSWLQRGSMWHAGRVWGPVTPEPRHFYGETAPQQPNLESDQWGVSVGQIWVADSALINAADLAAMTEALNNAS